MKLNLCFAILMGILTVANLFFTCWGLQYWGPGEGVWWGFPLTVCLLTSGSATFVSTLYFSKKCKR